MNPLTARKLIKITSDLYQKEVQSFSDTRRKVWEKEILDFIDNIEPGSSILDLGCGNGRLINNLELRTKNLKYLGVDASKKFIKLNKEKYYVRVSPRSDPRESASFEVGDGLKLKYKNKFDYVISIAVLHHIPSEELQLKFLKNVYKALKPGGKILISTWNRLNDKYLKLTNSKHKTLNSKQIQNLNDQNSKQFNNLAIHQFNNDLGSNDNIVPWRQSGQFRFIHTFEPEELKLLAQKAGFDNIKIIISKHGIKTNIKTALNIYLIAEK